MPQINFSLIFAIFLALSTFVSFLSSNKNHTSHESHHKNHTNHESHHKNHTRRSGPSHYSLTHTQILKTGIEPWKLPVVPPEHPDIKFMYNNSLATGNNFIPRHLWVAFKTIPTREKMPEYLNKMFDRNAALNWTIHLADNDQKLEFMETYYKNTSLLWAYKMIHPRVGNSAADIWRYAVLWLFGGLYMDDDSYFEAPFDKVIKENDTLVVAVERNPFKDECFPPDYKLSYASFIKRFNNTGSHLFGARTIVSWAIFAAPKHPIIYRMIENMVDIIKFEYLRKSVIVMQRYDAKWKMCMCSTGPALLTASAREVLLENNETGVNIVVHRRNFHDYGGVFKVWTAEDNPEHYMRTMQRHNIPLLSGYAPLSAADLEGKIISADGHELFLVKNGTRKGFANYDIFVQMNFNLKQVLRLPEDIVSSVPHNTTLMNEGDVSANKQSSV